uniref:C-type lectin domain-containing protein n=1 Tax=Poecilia reticulata TaxID=8081 RepID=A0A3P9NPE4_POERE
VSSNLYFFLPLYSQCCLMDCQLYEFHYINENKTWTEAQQYCREKHTDLVTVTNMKDMERLINISAGDQREAWIGLYDQTNGTRTWWSDGSSSSFRHWNLQFDNEMTNSGQCAMTVLDDGGRWKNENCSVRKPFICYGECSKHISVCNIKLHILSYMYFKKINFTTRLMWFNNKSLLVKYIFLIVHTFENYFLLHKFSLKTYSFIFYILCIFMPDKVILIKESKTWHEAFTYCRGHHHDLVTITNMDQQNQVQEKTKNASTPFVWIGLRFNCSRNVWFWVCDNWTWNEQNDCNMFGAMQAGGEHRWFQRNGSEKFNFICTN